MSTLRLAQIQMQSQADARDENVAKACKYIDEVADEKPDVIVLPEFFNHRHRGLARACVRGAATLADAPGPAPGRLRPDRSDRRGRPRAPRQRPCVGGPRPRAGRCTHAVSK